MQLEASYCKSSILQMKAIYFKWINAQLRDQAQLESLHLQDKAPS